MQGWFYPYTQLVFQCSVRMLLCSWPERALPVIASMPVGFYHKSVGGVFLSYQASASRSAWKGHRFSGCVATDLDTVRMACVVIIGVDEPSLCLLY